MSDTRIIIRPFLTRAQRVRELYRMAYAKGGRGGGRAGRASRAKLRSKSKRYKTVKSKRSSKSRNSSKKGNYGSSKGGNTYNVMDGVVKRHKIRGQPSFPKCDYSALKNAAPMQVSIDTGSTGQQYMTWAVNTQGVTNNYCGDVGLLQAAVKSLNTTADARLIFTKLYAHADITNATTATINFTAYVCMCRSDTTATPITCWANGITNGNDLNNLNVTYGGVVYTSVTINTLYQKPYASMLFNRYWKVISEREYTLGAGGSTRVGYSNPHVPKRFLNQYEIGQINCLKGFTMALMIVARGGAGDDQASVVGMDKGKLDIFTHQTAYFRVPQFNTPLIGYVASSTPAAALATVAKDSDAVITVTTT